tara:strand:- start:22 stop:294 length:273 start_codon:yes stop_codon:yes gene_type:complete
MKYEDLIAELKKIGKSNNHLINLTDKSNNQLKFFILPNELLLACYIHVLKDINVKEISCKNIAEIQKSIIGLDLEFNQNYLMSFFSNTEN